ncbi:hypothetical protein JCM10213v2_000641 [Rhodosporidiobolus nylandii]
MAEVWPPCRPPPPLFRLAGGRQSAHLAPDSLAQLAALPLKNPLRQQNYNKLWLENWGKPNLRLAGQIPFIPFDPLQRATPVLVRREYLSLSAVLDAEMEGLGKGWASVVVYGSPGVGKSTFLSYKANELMEAQRPFVFASAAASHAYLFCDIGVIEIPTELMDIDFLATTAVLVDSEAGSSAGVATGLLHAPRTFVVLAASPKNSSYRTLTKEGANFWTMQHWDKAEVSAVVELRRLMKQGDLDATQHSCLALRASFASSSLPRLEVADASSSSSAQSTYTELQLFGLLGPVAHPLFLYWPNDPDFSDEQNLSLAATKPLAVNSQSLITALHGQGVDDDLQRSDFHRVFLIEPRRPGTFSVYQPDYRLVIPTPLLRAYVRRSLSLYRRAERLTVLSAMLTQPTLKGFAFEAHALDHLVAATPPLSVTVVTVNGHTPYPLPAKPVSFNWDPSEDALPPTLKAPTLLIFPPLFGAFDALIYSPDGPLFFLQVTTSSTHQMKPARLRKIFNALPELAERELICVFVTNTQTSAVALVSKEYSALRGTSYAKEMTEEAAGGAEADRSTRSAKRVKRADFPDFQMGYLVLEESAVLNSLREAKRQKYARKALLASLLPHGSVHPVHPLLLVVSPPPADPVVSLYRSSANPAELAWEWSPPPLPVDPSAPAAGPPKKGLAALRAAKAGAAKGGKGTVDRVCWAPTGEALAVVVAPPPSPSPAPGPIYQPQLHLLSLHSGSSLSPSPLPIPVSSAKTRITHLSWHALPFLSSPSSPSPPSSSWALRIISTLPPFPKIVKETSASATGGPPSGLLGSGGGPGGPMGGGGGGGVFGAKQAMLERERAKEAQRALSLRDACAGEGGFPAWMAVPPAGGEEGDGDPLIREAMRSRGVQGSVLVVGDSAGRMHLFLGGSVFLGTSPASSSSAILSVSLLSSSSNALDLTAHSPIASRALRVPLPPTLPLLLNLSTALRAHLSHAFSALQEARNTWDEARRIGKGWLQRVTDVARPHGVTTPPPTLLLHLLLTGRPPPALAHFLASKMNERGLLKWEGEMSAALKRLRGACWMSVVPALERVVLMCMEAEGWGRWSSFAPHPRPRLHLLRALALASEAIACASRLQREVEEEERCFVHFGRWLRFELDKLSLADAPSDTPRPLALFLPLPVASYIRTRLPPTATTLSPYLSFGLATAPLAACEELKEAEAWIETVVPSLPKERAKEDDKEALNRTLRRLTEELRGQADAVELNLQRQEEDETRSAIEHGFSTAPPFAELDEQFEADRMLEDARRSDFAEHLRARAFVAEGGLQADVARPASPSKPSFPTSSAATPSPPPKSLPAMLHLLARLLGEAMDGAVRGATGESERVEKGEEAPLLVDEDGEGDGVRVRTRAVEGGVAEVRVLDGVVRFTRPFPPSSTPSFASSSLPDLSEVEHTALSLRTSDGAANVKVLEFELLEGRKGVELVMGCEVATEGAPPSFPLLRLPFSSLTWSSSPSSSTPHSPLPLPSDAPALDAHYPPSSLAFDTGAVEGETRVVSLSGEGRRIEVLSLPRASGSGSKAGDGERDARDVEMA